MTGTSVDSPETLELRPRIELSHPRITHILASTSIRGLHVKGYAVEAGVYPKHRSSSDVDLLVHPADAERAVAALKEHGWAQVTTFAKGSLFEHAATLWHDYLGYVDVHRLFPGLGPDPATTFERLWAEHTVRIIAGHPAPVPSLRHQRLVVLVHAARDAGRGHADVEHLGRVLSEDEWAALRTEAHSLGAEAAWSVATAEAPSRAANDHDLRLFTALHHRETGFDLFRTRWGAARSARERAALVLHTIPVNKAHLQMRLGRPITRKDILREQVGRVFSAAAWLKTKAVHRGH